MKGFVADIEKLTLENQNFRKVLYTAKNSQLVIMSLNKGEEIGEEVHNVDQFLRIEKGRGKAILNDFEYEIGDGSVVFVPAGVKHNIINTSTSEDMKLYTLYSPPHHQDGIVHTTKNEAMLSEEYFDGKTTE